jgi:uncharacterized membrane protein
MREPNRRFLERGIVSRALRVGVVVSAALMLAGVAMAGVKGRLRAHPVRISHLLTRLHGGHPSAYMALGILLLLATPIARVLLLVAGFSYARDWRFAAIASTVAVLIGVAIVLGRA